MSSKAESLILLLLLIFCIILLMHSCDINDQRIETYNAEIQLKKENLENAITDYFDTNDWILIDVEDGYFETFYIVSTYQGKYSITLNEDGTKVQKAFKDGVLSD